MIDSTIQNLEGPANICSLNELSGVAHTGQERCLGSRGPGEFTGRPGPGNHSQLRTAQRVEASVRYMMEHLNRPLKVSTLSALVGVSNSSFFFLFKNATGHTPLDFFIRARMRRAAELLEKTRLQIKEVAGSLGYDDQFYFSRLFKSVHGVAPREYRARKQQTSDESPDRKFSPGKRPGTQLQVTTSNLFDAPEPEANGNLLIAGFQPPKHYPSSFRRNLAEPPSNPY